MKRIKTIATVVVVLGLAYLAFNIANKNSGNSKLADEALSDFAYKDTAAIDQLIITDTKGNPGVTLKRTPKGWTMGEDECVQQHLVIQILETIKHIAVKSPVPEDAVENINKNLTTNHRKMEIYVDGEIVKTWYIGNPTADHYGTYMLLKDPEKGKSPEPFIMHLPSMFGNLESRFITDPLQFACTGIFNYDPLDIQSVEVRLPDSAYLNFKIVANGNNNFSLFNNQKSVSGFDTVRVREYLLHYKKIHFEQHNYLIDQKSADSLKSTTPQFLIAVTDQDGLIKQIACYKKKMTYEKYDFNGNLIEFDRDRLWVVLPNGDLVVGQYFTFDKILQDIRFFKPNGEFNPS